MGRRGRFLDRIGAEDGAQGTDWNAQKSPMQGKPEQAVTHVPQGRVTIIVSIEL